MPLTATPPVERLLAKLRGVKANGSGWVARCPAHDDSEPSLSVGIGRDGRALVRCHVGCAFNDIVAAVGLERGDLFADDGERPLAMHRPPTRVPTPARGRGDTDVEQECQREESRDWPVVASFDYVDADGEIVFQVQRKEPTIQPAGGKRKKTFTQRRPGANGWIPSIKDVAERPLFRLPELIDDLAHERTILLVEGEKDCITLRDLRFPATTHSGGAKGWRDEYARQLAGATVTILPDNDEPGRAWAATAAEALIGVGAVVKMCAVPIQTIGGDVTDWIEAGGSGAQLERLLTHAVPWVCGDPVPMPSAPSRFKLFSVRDLESLPPMEWLVGEERKGVLPAESLLAIFGAPGAGKSFIVADLACTLANRRADRPKTWFGHSVKQAPVLYVVAEGGRGFRHRIRAWRYRTGVEQDDLALTFLVEPVNLHGPEDITHLLRAIDHMPQVPSVVVFDTFARAVVGGEENSAKDVGLVIDRADRLKRETGASAFFVHHARKDDDTERGSGALRAGVDTLCLVREDEDGGRILSCEKQKDADPFEPITFYLASVGDSCVVSAQAPDARGLSTNQRTALRALANVFPKGATSTEWLKAAGLTDRTFYRVRARLVSDGYVSELERGNSTRYAIQPSGHFALNGLPK